ncbi:MAG TPA: TRAP transporter substrate-binding protein DctP [Deltaproteobacteria bacterium]|nr:TRAP transporter substrate-binding protein DctP [Deltaproteobacteria bacterium]HPJ92457.1 TRAP transporter substrate-binding protein DctP [Deltaproteobacteria bacterium]HPR50262.1 TRAP transporter substrate-binding protein DctP [Deltaproteobacteria bacterium]
MGKKGLFIIVVLALLLGLTAGVTPANAAEKVIKWKMTSTWPPSISLIEADQAFVKAANQICKGRLEIKFFTGGTLMPSYEVFDAVSKGTIEASGDWPNYWAGKDSVFDTLGSYPMGLTPIDYLLWIYQGGGQAIYDEAYGKFGIVYLVTGVTPMECGLRSNKPIKTLEDLKGMKIRMSGQTQGKLLKDLGAAQVAMSGQEIYQALQKGVIDAAEFSSPSSDWRMGFGEVTKYWAVPGWHQPASVMGVMINKKVWDELGPDLQEDLRYAAKAAAMEFTTKQYYDTIEFTQKFLDKGIQITTYDPSVLDTIEQLTNKHTTESAKANPLFKKSIESQIKFRKAFAQWRSMEGEFKFGFNPKTYPEIE